MFQEKVPPTREIAVKILTLEDSLLFLSFCRKLNGASQHEALNCLDRAQFSNWLIEIVGNAISGDNRPLNSWLFSHTNSPGNLIAWIAPVLANGDVHYSWMTGKVSFYSKKITDFFQKSHAHSISHPLLQQKTIPLPLLFVYPDIVSRARDTPDSPEEEDEFAIFQTSYKNERSEMSDFDQRMILNARYIRKYRRTVLTRYLAVGTVANPIVVSCLEKNMEFLGMIHSEGHNQGHFLGPLPFGKIKKSCLLYEPIEEYRSCLATLLLAELAGIDKITLEALALSIFLSRLAGYGYDAYCAPNKKRELAREVIVASLILKDALRYGAIKVRKNGIHLCTQKLLHGMREALSVLHVAESCSQECEVEKLRMIARKRISEAFPNTCYLNELLLLFTQIRKLEYS